MTATTAPTAAPRQLQTLIEQAERLIDLGLHTAAGLSPDELRSVVRRAGERDALLVLDPDRVPPSALAPLLRLGDRAGFVVEDMTDVDAFAPIPEAAPPSSAIYLVDGPTRGDEMANWSPDEALPAITSAGRTPLTLVEGIHWALQRDRKSVV